MTRTHHIYLCAVGAAALVGWFVAGGIALLIFADLCLLAGLLGE